MRRGPTEQVKRAVESLKRAGFKRNQFRVNVERRYVRGTRGRQYEYGEAEIVLRLTTEEETSLPQERIDALLREGFNVSEFRGTFDDGRPWRSFLIREAEYDSAYLPDPETGRMKYVSRPPKPKHTIRDIPRDNQ